MKVEQLPSGTSRVRIMIDGHRYTFTDKDRKRVKAIAASFADEHREAVENPTLQVAMEKYIEGRSKIRSESTIRGYDTIYRMMLDRYPDLCQKRVTNIRQSDLQNVVDTLDIGGLAHVECVNLQIQGFEVLLHVDGGDHLLELRRRAFVDGLVGVTQHGLVDGVLRQQSFQSHHAIGHLFLFAFETGDGAII